MSCVGVMIGLPLEGEKMLFGRHHQQARFHLRLDGQRNVHGHLVAVEVGVVGGTNERMNADRLAFDQLRLERLDRQTVQASARGSAAPDGPW
jgi:hypothetical protein